MLFALNTANAVNSPFPSMPTDSRPTLSPEDEKCLEDRKWWAFLLSSIFTLLCGKQYIPQYI